MYHHWVGRAALLGAFANAIIGCILSQLPAGFAWGMAIIWGAIWLAAGAKMLFNARHARRAQGLHGIAHAKEQEMFVASGASNGAPKGTGAV